MAERHISPESRRKNFRSLVLLALLGACAALAWMLAWHKAGPSRNAREILAEIRRNGIASYGFDNAMPSQWFLMYRGKKIVGWDMEYRRADANGAVGGFVRQSIQPEGQVRLFSRWQLSNNAEKGDYKSQRMTLRPPMVRVEEARIVLNGRDLQVAQKIDGASYSSSTTTPGNYLPEGLMPLVIRQVARRKTGARFALVEDATPPARQKGGQTPLFSFEIRYAGKDSRTGGAMVEAFFNPKHSVITVLDTAGNVLRRNQGDLQWKPVSREEVVRRFPSAADYVVEEKTMEL